MAFTMRTSKPQAGNKFYNNGNNGGYSWCISGYPTDRGCNVLANCVGYACGRFNEIIGSMKYKTLCCNAENFIERAKQAGLEVGMTPKVGAIMCWQRGSTLGGNDGAGHVAIVEKVYDNNHVYTSESGYGSSAFWNSHRYNSNGRWGLGSGYTFRGFIYNPAVKDEPKPTTPKPVASKFKVGQKVQVVHPINYDSGQKFQVYYNVYDVLEVSGARVVIGIGGTITSAIHQDNIKLYEAPKPQPIRNGDKIRIRKNAKDTNRGGYFADFVYNTTFIAMSVNNDGTIGFGNGSSFTGEVHKNDAYKV